MLKKFIFQNTADILSCKKLSMMIVMISLDTRRTKMYVQRDAVRPSYPEVVQHSPKEKYY
jgi:hypothetical protein